mmetsp:Transcript_15734/g.53409  ORF Transcript_15734/g.53409 Transcript_15734/m.53409 type:complete len:256 (-) Transcript_15734:486-1253(-)
MALELVRREHAYTHVHEQQAEHELHAAELGLEAAVQDVVGAEEERQHHRHDVHDHEVVEESRQVVFVAQPLALEHHAEAPPGRGRGARGLQVLPLRRIVQLAHHGLGDGRAAPRQSQESTAVLSARRRGAVLGDCRNGEEVQDEVRGVAIGRHGKAEAVEVLLHLLCCSAIHDAAAGREHHNVVEQLKYLPAGLVKRGRHGDAKFCQRVQRGHDGDGRGRVQPGRGLVEEHQRWFLDDFHAEGNALELPAAEPAA